MALSQEHFRFIVEQRAIGLTPDAITLNFVRQFKGVQPCTLGDIALADRETLPPDWQKVWDDALRRFMDAPTASREYRVALLHEKAMSERARGAKFEHLIEQIAKEMADAYSPKGVLGKPAAPPAAEQIEEIRVTYIDPKNPEPVAP